MIEYNYDKLVEHINRELNINGLDQTEYKEVCLRWIEVVNKLSNNNQLLIEQFVVNLDRMVKMLPVTELTGDDTEVYKNEQGIYHNIRYPGAMSLDNEHWEDSRCVRYVKDNYNKGFNTSGESVKPFSYPYYPNPIEVHDV
jgi:hypothetical protein